MTQENVSTKPARLIGPGDGGLRSRIDVYLHDGRDEQGEEFGERATLRFDEAMTERAARAMNLEAGRLRGLAFEDDWDEITETERGGWRLCARSGLVAALQPSETAVTG
jgi:hypothetical protein